MGFIMANRMTVRTTNNTFGDFPLGLGNALGEGNVEFLRSRNMIEVQRRRMFVVSAVNATMFDLVVVQKLLQVVSAGKSLPPDFLPVGWIGQSLSSPLSGFLRVIGSFPWPSVGLFNFFWVTRLPFARCLSRLFGMRLPPLSRAPIQAHLTGRLVSAPQTIIGVKLTGWFFLLASSACECVHREIIPHIFHANKPDIFAATYERAE